MVCDSVSHASSKKEIWIHATALFVDVEGPKTAERSEPYRALRTLHIRTFATFRSGLQHTDDKKYTRSVIDREWERNEVMGVAARGRRKRVE
jgi:hypothetical protein